MSGLLLKLPPIGGAILVLTACGGEPAPSASWQGVVDTVEGVVVISNPAQHINHGERAWRLEEDLDIGVIEGDPDYQFASIDDLAVDEAGNIYVLDGQARNVVVYDSTGRFQHRFGRQGEGPGEFENPREIFWKADTLVVWDWRLRRLSYFDRQGKLLRDERPEIPFGFRGFSYRPDGALWIQLGPTWSMPIRPESDGIGNIVVFDPVEQTTDTVLTWKNDAAIAIRAENFMTITFEHYAPQLNWTADGGGHLFVARGDEYEIEVYGPAGERVRTIVREYTRHPPSAAEVDSARAEHERGAERYGEQADRYRKAFEIADRKPATGELAISEDGHLWVRVFTDDDRTSIKWDIFDPDGRYISSLETPRIEEIRSIIGDRVYADFMDEFDVAHVKRYTIVRSAEAEGTT